MMPKMQLVIINVVVTDDAHTQLVIVNIVVTDDVHTQLIFVNIVVTDDAQTQLALVSEKERVASDQLLEMNAVLAALKLQVTTLKQEKAQLLSQLEVEKNKREMAEDARNRLEKIHKIE